MPVCVAVAVLVPLEDEEPEAVTVAVPLTAVLRWPSVPVLLPVDDSVRV